MAFAQHQGENWEPHWATRNPPTPISTGFGLAVSEFEREMEAQIPGKKGAARNPRTLKPTASGVPKAHVRRRRLSGEVRHSVGPLPLRQQLDSGALVPML